MILPTSQLACAQDCMWWLAMRPVAPERTVLSLGGCFPKSTAALPNFADDAQSVLRPLAPRGRGGRRHS